MSYNERNKLTSGFFRFTQPTTPNYLMATSESASIVPYDYCPSGLGVRDAKGAIVRAYVIKTYTADDKTVPASMGSSETYDGKAAEGSGIYCDLWVFEHGFAGPLHCVPVMSRHHGVADVEIWKPRPATIVVGKGTSPELERTKEAGEPLHNCNGDVVLVQFMGNDIFKPVIVGALPHPEATIVATSSDSPNYRYLRQIHGNKFGIEDGGKMTLDFTGQSDGSAILPDGTETPAPSPTLEVKGQSYTATINASGMVINRGGVTFTMDGDGVSIALNGEKCVVSGGEAIGGIQMGEDATSQGLATVASLADIAHLLNEWLPTIMAAGGMFGTAASLVHTPNILAGLVQATAPASVPSSSPGGAGASIKTVQLIGD